MRRLLQLTSVHRGGSLFPKQRRSVSVNSQVLSIPVITREMLVAARQPLYYRMREAVVGLSILFMFAVVLNSSGRRESGLELYTALHCSVVTMILFFAPAL